MENIEHLLDILINNLLTWMNFGLDHSTACQDPSRNAHHLVALDSHLFVLGLHINGGMRNVHGGCWNVQAMIGVEV